MTYLALARKWRPKTFADVAGQSHVVRALENALTSGRLHHAFLFTGTRGVGKTTIARIFVKALNCERGISATPCGECSACLAIDQGRFMDFLEVDAASRTGVDDARELLENAQYTPSSGKFKVYLIDEVHMLSKQAFNALLKTLEEPPAHVKFLLATTDPQKIPVTVLSRCLQFNLKRLPQAVIIERLATICASEGIPAEPGASGRLARAAAGSMRDALSLLDQALAYGNGRLTDAEVAAMLGSLDRSRVLALLKNLASGDARQLLDSVRQLDELVPDYNDILGDLAGLLQRIAVIQIAGQEQLDEDEEVATLVALAGQMAPETVQLMYQIVVTGRRDLGLAPDPRTGFEMTLLRVLAFQPEAAHAVTTSGERPPPARAVAPSSPVGAARPGPADVPQAAAAIVLSHPVPPVLDAGNWPAFVEGLSLDGAVRQLAANSALESTTPFELRLGIERRNSHLLTDNLKTRLTGAIQERLGGNMKVQFSVQEEARDTAAGRRARNEETDLNQARQAIAADSNVQQLTELFGAQVVPESVKRTPAGRGPGKR